MVLTFKITSTGTLASMVFPEWGNRTLTHPVVAFDLLPEFGIEELVTSPTLQAYLDAGHLTAVTDKRVVDTSAELVLLLLNVYGTEYNYTSEESESTNSTDTPQTKLTLTTTDLPAGWYRAEIFFEVANTSTAGSAVVSIDIDGIAGSETRVEPKDVNNYLPISGFRSNLNWPGGVLDITINFWNVGTGTAKIKRCRAEIYRIS